MKLYQAHSLDDGFVQVNTRVSTYRHLAILATPCPIGRVARSGMGGQSLTPCSACGEVFSSTAIGQHEGTMLTPVIAHGSFIEDIGDVVIYEIATPEFIKGIDRLVDTPFVEGDAVHWAGDDFNDVCIIVAGPLENLGDTVYVIERDNAGGLDFAHIDDLSHV